MSISILVSWSWFVVPHQKKWSSCCVQIDHKTSQTIITLTLCILSSCENSCKVYRWRPR